MKKIIFLLFPLLTLAQNPTNFPYGIKNPAATSDSAPAYFTTTQVDGVHKKTPAALVAKVAIVNDSLATKENVANKSDSYTASSSTTYASTKALVDGLGMKANDANVVHKTGEEIKHGILTLSDGLKIVGNTTSTTATKVNVQENDGIINTISKSDLVNVVEVNDVPSLPLIGEVGKIYVVKNLNKIYRWNSTFYQELAVTDITNNYKTLIDASSIVNTRNDAGSVIDLDNGELLIAYAHFNTNPSDDGESSIWAAKSTDRGQTWGVPFQLIPKILGGSYIPSFYKKSNGNIIVVYHVLTVSTIPYQSSIYKSEFTQELVEVGSATEIYNLGYTAPISDRLYYDLQNDKLLFPFAKLVSGDGGSSFSVYESRFLESSNEGTTWIDAGVTLGSTLINSSGYGGAQEPGFYFDPYKNKTVMYVRTLLGRIYATDLNYSSGYTIGSVYPMELTSMNATSSIKYWESKNIFVATVMRLIGSDPLIYGNRKQIDLLTSVDGVSWSANNIIDKVDSPEVLNEPNIFLDDLKQRVLVSYSKTNGGVNFDFLTSITPITNISQSNEKNIKNQNFYNQKADLKIEGGIDIFSSNGGNPINIKRKNNLEDYALINFQKADGSNSGYVGLGKKDDNCPVQIFGNEGSEVVSGLNKSFIFGNQVFGGTAYGLGYINNKLLLSTDNRTRSFFENETNYEGALTVIGDTKLEGILNLKGAKIQSNPAGEVYVNFNNSKTGGVFFFGGGTSEKTSIYSDGRILTDGSVTASSFNGGATLTGTPTAPTATAGTNTTQIATTAFVQNAMTSGTYVPTFTNTTNISSSTLNAAYYTKINNIITVTIAVQLTLTATADTVFTFSLPVSGATVVNGVGQGNLTSGGGSVNAYGIVDTTNSTTAQLRIGSAAVAGSGAGVANIIFTYSL